MKTRNFVCVTSVTDYDISQCKDFDWICHCGIPKDVVSEISIQPKAKLKFSTLGIDKSKFEKSRNPDDLNITIYDNDEAGIAYTVSEKDDSVMYISYVASAKECEEIRKKR